MDVDNKVIEIQSIAAKRGGVCLSNKYVNNKTKLRWKCAKGHEWEAHLNSIKNGHWCPYCANRARLTIEEMQSIASKRGGKCLSSRYTNNKGKLRWRCAKGHEWHATPNEVKHGTWCKRCSGLAPLTIEEMRSIASERRGECLSDKYINVRTKLRWKCADGHEWETLPSNIRNGNWCPYCGMDNVTENICREIFELIFNVPFPKIRPKWLKNDRGNRMELDGHNEKFSLAFEYHGEQHFIPTKFFQQGEKTLDRRKSDDELKRRLCRRMSIKLIEIPFDVETNKLYAYILHKCEELSINVPIHENVDVQKTKSNYHSAKISELALIAEKRGGELLSQTYLGKDKKLKWKCVKGHEWEAIPHHIRGGHWCKRCAGLAPLTIEEMWSIASKRGGKCLSDKYINTLTKLRWGCAYGHKWMARPNDIKNGHWCPECARKI